MSKPVPDIVPAREEHIDQVALGVRPPDRLELFLASCESPASVLRRSLRASTKAWTGTIDGRPVCMFGVTPGTVLGDVGHPWMVGTKELERHTFIFLRRCKPCVQEMLACFSTLENYVHLENLKAIQWLMWLGFSVTIPGQPLGPFGAPFCHFKMRRNG